MAIEVKCSVYNGDDRVIDKKPTLLKTLSCKITNPQDILNPELLLLYDKVIDKSNYFVIGHRKYFKVKQVRQSANMVKLFLKEDVYSTWIPRCNIKGIINYASVIMSENTKQDYLIDENVNISRIKIGNNYEEVTSDPILIVQCPLPTIKKQ